MSSPVNPFDLVVGKLEACLEPCWDLVWTLLRDFELEPSGV